MSLDLVLVEQEARPSTRGLLLGVSDIHDAWFHQTLRRQTTAAMVTPGVGWLASADGDRSRTHTLIFLRAQSARVQARALPRDVLIGVPGLLAPRAPLEAVGWLGSKVSIALLRARIATQIVAVSVMTSFVAVAPRRDGLLHLEHGSALLQRFRVSPRAKESYPQRTPFLKHPRLTR